MPAFLFIRHYLSCNIKTMPAKKINPLFLLLTLLPTALYANTYIDVSTKLLHFNYEEFDTSGQTLNTEIGVIPGVSLTLSNAQKRLTNSIGIEIYNGQVTYDGHTQLGAPHITKTDETQYALSYGLNWSVNKNTSTVFSKIFWQNWNRDILPSNGVSGLFERYQWWRFEIGAHTSIYKKNDQDLSIEFAVLKTNNGRIEVDLSNFGYGVPELKLGDSHGINMALQYRIDLKQNENIQFSVRYTRWEFGRSNSETLSNGITQITIVEPQSVSQTTTLSVSYHYEF